MHQRQEKSQIRNNATQPDSSIQQKHQQQLAIRCASVRVWLRTCKLK